MPLTRCEALAAHDHCDHAAMASHYGDLVLAAAHCVKTGDACIAHGLSLLGEEDKECQNAASLHPVLLDDHRAESRLMSGIYWRAMKFRVLCLSVPCRIQYHGPPLVSPV